MIILQLIRQSNKKSTSVHRLEEWLKEGLINWVLRRQWHSGKNPQQKAIHLISLNLKAFIAKKLKNPNQKVNSNTRKKNLF